MRLHIFSLLLPVRTIIIFEPCALNAIFQHFILRLSKIFVLCDTTERADRGLKQAQREGEDRVILQLTLLHMNFKRSYVHDFICVF
jgi:hypothetical protein